MQILLVFFFGIFQTHVGKCLVEQESEYCISLLFPVISHVLSLVASENKHPEHRLPHAFS